MRPDGSFWLRSPRFGSDTCWGLLVLGVAPLTPRLRPFSSDRNIPTRALKPDPKTPIPYRMSLSLKVASEYPQVSMPGALAACGAPRGAADTPTVPTPRAAAATAAAAPRAPRRLTILLFIDITSAKKSAGIGYPPTAQSGEELTGNRSTGVLLQYRGGPGTGLVPMVARNSSGLHTTTSRAVPAHRIRCWHAPRDQDLRGHRRVCVPVEGQGGRSPADR